MKCVTSILSSVLSFQQESYALSLENMRQIQKAKFNRADDKPGGQTRRC